MPLLRLNEHYTSVQGEGPHTGVMTQFVRFSGCNMKCAGWPCDTEHAINPTLYRNDPRETPDMVISRIYQMRATTGANNICITGGEPFLQDHDHLRQIVVELLNADFTFDIFTNGSFVFPRWVESSPDISIIMDWKLAGSGEADTKLNERKHNASRLHSKDAIKFVCKNRDDLEEAVKVSSELNLGNCQIYVGRVWDGPLTDAQIVQFLQDHTLHWVLNIQMHKYIFPGIERGI